MVGNTGCIGIGVLQNKKASSAGPTLNLIATPGQTVFNLPKPAQGAMVIINRVPQIPDTDYEFATPGTEIIFQPPGLEVGDSVQIIPFY